MVDIGSGNLWAYIDLWGRIRDSNISLFYALKCGFAFLDLGFREWQISPMASQKGCWVKKLLGVGDTPESKDWVSNPFICIFGYVKFSFSHFFVAGQAGQLLGEGARTFKRVISMQSKPFSNPALLYSVDDLFDFISCGCGCVADTSYLQMLWFPLTNLYQAILDSWSLSQSW